MAQEQRGASVGSDGSGGGGSGGDSSGGDGGGNGDVEAQPPQAPSLVHLVLSLLIACCDVLCGTFEVKLVVQ